MRSPHPRVSPSSCERIRPLRKNERPGWLRGCSMTNSARMLGTVLLGSWLFNFAVSALLVVFIAGCP
jgi:hypothetical protein